MILYVNYVYVQVFFYVKILFIILASQVAIGGVCIKVYKRSLTSLNEEENHRFFAKQFNFTNSLMNTNNSKFFNFDFLYFFFNFDFL